jgi:hypothetical protein
MKKIFSILAILMLLIAFYPTDVKAQTLVNAFSRIMPIGSGDKGDLYGNAEGTFYCCKVSDYKECSAAQC